ncbi:hypothetical protein C1N91_03910 [Curtobacterium sp. SGAir0471]|uniref:cohesin domain-containing protein n=1 Tax=Curtobacterium sp. SGAir0471 TaxID=2070337 RepID=UPI0010CCEF83|nr:cohesin domain-containing protein [Curtobacterium sp. SGAir0471]QCR42814.1 hypothetical protein C1N91_03910 [Curtobacterium sp. SGAir0471]
MQHRTLRCPRAAIVPATIAAGAIGLTVLAATPAAAAPTATTVRIAAPSSATVGEPIDLDVTIPATTDVYAYEITIDTDEDALAVVDGSVTGPDGGFDRVEQDADTITIVHSRLGTSPALSGDLAASVALTPTAAGDTDLAVSSVVLVGSDGSSTTLTDPVSTTVSIAAVPTPTPTATPDPTDAPDPAPSTSTTPTPGSTATAVPAGAAGAPGRPAGGALAWTGADVAPWAAASLALLALGTTLVTLRARRARRERNGDAA